jgi:hypothetical protein
MSAALILGRLCFWGYRYGRSRAIAFEMCPVKYVILSDQRERRIPFESTIQPHTTRFFVATLLRMTTGKELESKCNRPNGRSTNPWQKPKHVLY